MSVTEKQKCLLLPHHEQQDLCTTRLPYRQGRKLTAVKVYTIANESKHLLIFGVPSLNLRRETKELFLQFGKLLQFNLTNYPSEQFTETYHALYESIQSARMAKRKLDTKNYYGGNLHICYAPELETVEEAKEKLILRKTQVIGRLKNLQREADMNKHTGENKIESNPSDIVDINPIVNSESIEKVYMGSSNTIIFGKRKAKATKINPKKSKTKITDIQFEFSIDPDVEISKNWSNPTEASITNVKQCENVTSNNIEIIDFTSMETGVISNINEALNYNNFGKEVIKKIPYKPVNRIKFNINKHNLIYTLFLNKYLSCSESNKPLLLAQLRTYIKRKQLPR